MSPLPKYMSVLAILAAIFGALNSADVLAIVGPKVSTIINLVAVIVAALTHSLGGSGGKTPPAV